MHLITTLAHAGHSHTPDLAAYVTHPLTLAALGVALVATVTGVTFAIRGLAARRSATASAE
ncbi:MAG: hypothetical protein AAGI54_13420 [Planctomycetota bacterium]